MPGQGTRRGSGYLESVPGGLRVSRRYSVTYGELREERTAHQDAERREAEGLPPVDDRVTVVEAEWAFMRSGLARGEEMIVESIRAGQETARRIRSA
jgi:hypothetical protein